MKLASLKNSTRDGRLIVVSKDNKTYSSVEGVPTMQFLLDNWDEHVLVAQKIYEKLNSKSIIGLELNTKDLLSPLPRAYEWIDGSAYLNHVVLVRKARNAEPPATLYTDPLIYQGGSGIFLSSTDDIILQDEAWGLDFESEICVILGDTPQGTNASSANSFIKLVMIANDISLRNLIPEELAKGFGFFQSKPATAFSPFAVTLDELGDSWFDGRLHLSISTYLNGKMVGNTLSGPEMHFSFCDLIQHITKTRSFTAGTILGSGTVSNKDRERGISCLAEQRMIEIIEKGKAETPFLTFGDEVNIHVKNSLGESIFGEISQKVRAFNK